MTELALVALGMGGAVAGMLAVRLARRRPAPFVVPEPRPVPRAAPRTVADLPYLSARRRNEK